MRFPTLDEHMILALGPETPSILLFGTRHGGPGRRTLYTVHKKAGLSRKERDWHYAGPSLAGSTESAERL